MPRGRVSLGWSAGSLPASSSFVEPCPPSSSQPQLHSRHSDRHHVSQTPPRSRPASYCSSSSEVYSSSSSLDDGLSQLAIQPDTAPSLHPITTQGTQSSRLDYENTVPNHINTTARRYSSSSDGFSSTSSFDNDLSQLVIEYDEPLLSQPTAHNRHSPLGDPFSSTFSLDHELSQLNIEEEHPSSPRWVTAQSSHARQPLIPHTPPPRRAAVMNYYSSSSEASSLVLNSQEDLYPELKGKEEALSSSQSTTESTQSHLQGPQHTQPIRIPGSPIPTTPAREWDIPSPKFGSPSSTGKLSDDFSSPTPSPPRTAPSSSPSPSPSPRPSPSTRSPRLYRTRSGSLVNIMELRARREREAEMLGLVLKGIAALDGARIPSSRRRSITMCLNESGRWRIGSIKEPWGP